MGMLVIAYYSSLVLPHEMYVTTKTGFLVSKSL